MSDDMLPSDPDMPDGWINGQPVYGKGKLYAYARAAILADRARVAQRELADERLLELADNVSIKLRIRAYDDELIAFARAVLAAGGRHG